MLRNWRNQEVILVDKQWQEKKIGDVIGVAPNGDPQVLSGFDPPHRGGVSGRVYVTCNYDTQRFYCHVFDLAYVTRTELQAWERHFASEPPENR